MVPVEKDDRIFLTLKKEDATNDGYIELKSGMYSRLEIEEI